MIASENRQGLALSMLPVPDSGSDLHAILHSVTLLLAETIGCHCVSLILLNEDGQSARLHLLRLDLDVPDAAIVRDVPMEHAALAALMNGRNPQYIPNLVSKLAAVPDLVQLASIGPSSSAHVFPVSSAQERPGILVFVTNNVESGPSRNLELMSSAAVLISTFLDTALAFAAAEAYKQNLARERDRLKLLLEINNYTIAHLDMSALFRAASKSLLSFFDNAFDRLLAI